MTFDNMNTEEPGMPIVFDAPIVNNFMLLAMRVSLACTTSTKNQYRGLKRLTFVQRRSLREVAIQIEGAEFTTTVIRKSEDLPHPIDEIMVSNKPNNKEINKNEGKGSFITSHQSRVVVGLDRIGLTARYTTTGRGWRRWANQLNNNNPQVQDLDYTSDTVRLVENNQRDIMLYAQSNKEITRVPKSSSALTKLVFQIKCAYGTLAKLINKAGRKAPHGSLHLTANVNDDAILRLGIKGVGLDGTETLEQTTIKSSARMGQSVAYGFIGSVSAVIHYKEWFRFAREKSRNGYSIEKSLVDIPHDQSDITEIFGITEDGRFTYGIQIELASGDTDCIYITFPKTDLASPIEYSQLAVYADSGWPATRTSTSNGPAPGERPPAPMPVVVEPTIEPVDLTPDEDGMIALWEEAHRAHCTSRNMRVSQDRLVWFRHYMTQCLASGDRVGESHLTLYSKLRDQED